MARAAEFTGRRLAHPRRPSYLHTAVTSKLDSMQVRVLFFGVLKDLLSSSGEALTLPEGTTVTQLL
ncbi:MAG: hypothetical protein JWM54_517, partial [Acidobacteriaceae bacterium]|nr:hypothetical protein [Acidobacteriaceae bacterium]